MVLPIRAKLTIVIFVIFLFYFPFLTFGKAVNQQDLLFDDAIIFEKVRHADFVLDSLVRIERIDVAKNVNPFIGKVYSSLTRYDENLEGFQNTENDSSQQTMPVYYDVQRGKHHFLLFRKRSARRPADCYQVQDEVCKVVLVGSQLNNICKNQVVAQEQCP